MAFVLSHYCLGVRNGIQHVRTLTPAPWSRNVSLVDLLEPAGPDGNHSDSGKINSVLTAVFQADLG